MVLGRLVLEMGDYLFCPNIHPKQKGRLALVLVQALVQVQVQAQAGALELGPPVSARSGLRQAVRH